MLEVRSLVVVVIMVLASVAHADDKKYTLADLKALVGQSAFKEAFQHLGDISPSQRTAEWVDLAAAASGWGPRDPGYRRRHDARAGRRDRYASTHSC